MLILTLLPRKYNDKHLCVIIKFIRHFKEKGMRGREKNYKKINHPLLPFVLLDLIFDEKFFTAPHISYHEKKITS